ncbi:MAG: ATP synthase F1 subcomplex gamma subunit [Parcubacteria group bacterium GW2011_GWA2_42_14]|nr:MAG: ATP synthase F1 subcomplex gamma subunit [Parcubacteria group bacterium GW2011_GWA2_42_14]
MRPQDDEKSMPSVKSIKQRIKSVKNTRQITKAMEVVSATKMRKSQQFAIEGRPYALAAMEMLGNVLARTRYRPPLLRKREIKQAALVVVTSDKGLAGAFNSNVLRKAEKWILENKQNYPVDLVTVGRKSRDYFQNRKENVVKEFIGFGDFIEPNQTKPLSDFLTRGFLKKQWDLVEIIYTNFRSTLKQEVKMVQLFPVDLEKIKDTIVGITPEYGRFAVNSENPKSQNSPPRRIPGLRPSEANTFASDPNSKQIQNYLYEYKFEPSPKAILNSLIPHLLEMQIFHMILESNASEHSARMVAMKNASENAADIIQELTLQYNKSRQAGITRELTEITAGKEALEV